MLCYRFLFLVRRRLVSRQRLSRFNHSPSDALYHPVIKTWKKESPQSRRLGRMQALIDWMLLRADCCPGFTADIAWLRGSVEEGSPSCFHEESDGRVVMSEFHFPTTHDQPALWRAWVKTYSSSARTSQGHFSRPNSFPFLHRMFFYTIAYARH